MKKLAIFDLDGTLFDTKDVNYHAYKEAISEFGYQIDYEYYCNYCNGRHYTDFLPQITTNNEEILTKMHKLKKIAYKKYLNKAVPNEHLFDLINLMNDKYYIALVTTASRSNCYEILEAFEVKGYFDLILTHEDITKVKPDPEGFLKAMDYFKVKKDNTIIFEDSDVGIKAAKSSGAKVMIVCGYN